MSEPDVIAASASSGARTVFRHSVVPGGVYTADEAQAAMSRDSTVADHYRQVSPAVLHPETLAADQLVYMSYRIGDQIYWTKNKVLLREGERILTDGVNRIRARCGNCLSLQPMQPTADAEPDSAEFDALTQVEPEIIPSSVLPWRGTMMPSGSLAPSLLFPGASSAWLFIPADGMASGPVGSDAPLSDLTAGNPSRSGLGVFRDFPTAPVNTGLPPLIDLPTLPGEHPLDFGTEEDRLLVENPFPDPTKDPVPVPEPGSLLLLGGGITALLARRRCR
jgi:hypothetical protein